MAISVGGAGRRRRADRSAQFYEAILEEVEELDAGDQMALVQAFTAGQPWEELPPALQALVTNLLDWTREHGKEP
jgi:hypothetical protein